ncbi:MAG: cobalamin-binding protein [bacterium]|nr:cobalamin-binding protein [bacterium]
MADLQGLIDALTESKREVVEQVTTLTQAALDEGVDAKEILQNGLIAGMNSLGVRFKAGEAFIPEVFMAARAMNIGMDMLQSKLIEAGVEPTATVVLGTVKGDMHDIGKNLVGMMFTGAGLKVVDIGTDVPAEKFVEACKAEGAAICAMSALLTTTMPRMGEVIAACKEAGLEVKTLIGGAPITQAYADEIGADGFAADAASAADKAKELIGV